MSFIYLDYNATAPLCTSVITACTSLASPTSQPATATFGNASSKHAAGIDARNCIDEATERVIDLVMSESVPEDVRKDYRVLWTSGGTEANAMVVEALRAADGPSFIATTTVEHPAVTSPAKAAGIDCRFIDITYGPDGATLTPAGADALRAWYREATNLFVISVMAVNNEVGWRMPLEAISDVVAELRADPSCDTPILFHSDCAQILGKLPLYLDTLREVDVVSVAGHKFGAPKGIGALVYRSRVADHLVPIFRGGSQQGGKRAGTEPVFLAMLLGAAAAQARASLVDDAAPRLLAARRDLLLSELQAATHCDIVVRTPLSADAGLPNTLCITFDCADTDLTGWALQAALRDRMGFSTGPACSSIGAGGMAATCYPVSVSLRGLGLTSTEASRTIRLSLGPTTTEEAVRRGATLLAAEVNAYVDKKE